MKLDEILSALHALPEEEQEKLADQAIQATHTRRFVPSPGPQTEAYFSKADVLLYGGAGGGGKTALVAGLALEEHRRSLIVRKNYSDLEKGGGMIDEVLKFYGSRAGFRGGTQALLRFDDHKVITFGGVNNVGDEEKFQGQPRDLLAIDEATQMREAAVRFLMGWVRSEVEGQRTRTILATNPPLSSIGNWIIGMFRPWLDITHPNPAKNGELRWFVTDPDGNDFEVPDAKPYLFPGADRAVIPKSRTFIPAKLEDNPFLIYNDDYRSTQDSLPEPLRSAIRDGNFMAARQDDDFQVIPTDWIRAAMDRWTPEPPQHAPMSCLAADIAQGGPDNTTLMTRYDGWFSEIKSVPGRETPTGNEVAGLIIAERRNQCAIAIDMGGGYGGATKMRLNDNEIKVIGHKGAEKTSRRTVDQQFGFYNTRSMAYWRLREALDPSQDGGSNIALPNDSELLSDLTAPTFEITARGVKVESKEKVVEKLGRSPDRGDVCVICNLYGPTLMTHGNQWRKYSQEHGGKRKSAVKVDLGHNRVRRRAYK